jgi:hypothetical protein
MTVTNQHKLRIAVGVTAICIIALMAIWLVDQHRQRQGVQVMLAHNKQLTPAVAQQASDRFHQAKLLNLDSDPDLYTVSAWLAAGRPKKAAAVVQQVVQHEPQNASAWGLLAKATAQFDPRRSREASMKVEELNPK